MHAAVTRKMSILIIVAAMSVILISSVLTRGFPEGTVPFGPAHVPFGQCLNCLKDTSITGNITHYQGSIALVPVALMQYVP